MLQKSYVSNSFIFLQIHLHRKAFLLFYIRLVCESSEICFFSPKHLILYDKTICSLFLKKKINKKVNKNHTLTYVLLLEKI